MKTAKFLLQNGRHLGEVISSEYDPTREEANVTLRFEHGVKLPYNVEFLGRRESFLQGWRKTCSYSQLLGKKYLCTVELHVIETERGRIGLNVITEGYDDEGT